MRAIFTASGSYATMLAGSATAGRERRLRHEGYQMLKQIALLKRRSGMTVEEFKRYYENVHSKLGERYMPLARRYFRRYVHPEPNPITGVVEELDFDVVMEIWWDSREDFENTMREIGRGDVLRLFTEDEEKLFDKHNNRVFTVEEHESVMARPLTD